MKLSEHFSYAEFTHSDTALRLGIVNDLPLELVHNAQATAAMMERIREFLGVPLTVTSGYRCHLLNKTIGSKDTSDHVKALACDFIVPGTPAISIAKRLDVDKLQIGQLIYEFESWIHVAVPYPDKVLNRVLTVNKNGYSVGVDDGT